MSVNKETIVFYQNKIVNKDFDKENEQWKLIYETNNLYAISSLGRVMSMYDGHIMKTAITNKGYELLVTHINKKQKGYTIHRLVAEAFIPNPNNFPIVNHKDENPLNNNVDNLEWCTSSYNNTYNDIHIKNGIKRRGKPSHNKMKTTKKYENKEVLMLTKNKELVKIFNTVSEAAYYISELYDKKHATALGKIWDVIHNKSNTYLGYIWEMRNKENNLIA